MKQKLRDEGAPISKSKSHYVKKQPSYKQEVKKVTDKELGEKLKNHFEEFVKSKT